MLKISLCKSILFSEYFAKYVSCLNVFNQCFTENFKFVLISLNADLTV